MEHLSYIGRAYEAIVMIGCIDFLVILFLRPSGKAKLNKKTIINRIETQPNEIFICYYIDNEI